MPTAWVLWAQGENQAGKKFWSENMGTHGKIFWVGVGVDAVVKNTIGFTLV